MNIPAYRQQSRPAFTLIELLVVIAIIAILAALIFPITAALKKARMRSVAQTELSQMETWIDAYKAKHGFYPPDAATPESNQLYFELMGTELTNNVYQTLDGAGRINVTAVSTIFGPRVGGFMNSQRSRGGDGPVASSFIRGLKPAQSAGIAELTPDIKVLVCSVGWPNGESFQPLPANRGMNPWRYVSSNPTNNPNSYDVWVDIKIGNTVHRVSNWSKNMQVVP
jgi:prepilin-type N-terminal cleavage/methylation domain-containing protein